MRHKPPQATLPPLETSAVLPCRRVRSRTESRYARNFPSTEGKVFLLIFPSTEGNIFLLDFPSARRKDSPSEFSFYRRKDVPSEFPAVRRKDSPSVFSFCRRIIPLLAFSFCASFPSRRIIFLLRRNPFPSRRILFPSPEGEGKFATPLLHTRRRDLHSRFW